MSPRIRPSDTVHPDPTRCARLAAWLYSSAACAVIASLGLAVVSLGSTPAAGADPQIRSRAPGIERELSREWVWTRQPQRFDTMWRVPR